MNVYVNVNVRLHLVMALLCGAVLSTPAQGRAAPRARKAAPAAAKRTPAEQARLQRAAKRRYQRGTRAYKAGNYRLALQQYQAAAAVLRAYLAENPEHRKQEGEESGKEPAGESTDGGGGTSTRRGYSRGGGRRASSAPAQLESWDAAKGLFGVALSRQLADYFLRGIALGEGAIRSLTDLAASIGWTGSLD